MLTVIAQISIETESTSGNGPSFALLAAWIAGSAMLVMLVFLGFGIVRIVKGKNTADSEATKSGLRQSAISLGGAVILGTSAGAIAWSADNETYNLAGTGDRGFANLLPAGARPQEVTVQRQGALVNCGSVVTIEAENHGNWVRSTTPTEEEHRAIERMLEANNALDDIKQQVMDRGGMYNGSQQILSVDEDSWGETSGTGETSGPGTGRHAGALLSRVEWIPTGSEGGCTRENPLAASETEVRVEVWIGEGESGWATSDTESFTFEAP